MRPPTTPVTSTTGRTLVDPIVGARHDVARTTLSTLPSANDQEMLAHPAENPHRTRQGVRLPRVTCGRALLVLAISAVVLLGGTLAAATLDSGSGSPVAGAQPLPVPTIAPDPCDSIAPPAICVLPTPTTTPPLTGLPLPTGVPTPPSCDPEVPLELCPTNPTTTTPCAGEGCIPQPDATTAPPTNPDTGQPGEGEEPEDECGITDIGACITEAIDAFFRGIVTEALNPLLDLLSKTLLTTPMPDSLPRVGELWDNSWQILLVSYGLLVLIAGMIAMGYQTVQTRHSIKELAPRLVVGFLAGALSLWVATKGIQIANALVAAIMDGGVDATTAGDTLRTLVLGSLGGGIWIIFIGIVLAGMLVALLITYVVRVALTIILIAGAPLALMFHALPQTEGIAYWWWKAYGGCLAIQLAQSLTLITAVKVFLAPGGFTLFGPTMSGLVNLLVALALMYILFKIPFWVLSSIRGGGGRGLVGSLVRGFIAYKAFGMLRGRGGGKGSPPQPSGGSSRGDNGGSNTGGAGSHDPYATPRTTANGQYVLPLPGVRRSRPTGTSTPKTQAGATRKQPASPGRQLPLPLGDDWPENKPVLGRDGQYQLPLNGVHRVPRPAEPPPPPAPRTSGRRVVQLEVPFDPYKGNRPTRNGQYPLPLDGLRRVPAPTPPPAPPPGPVPRPGRQLRLPLDLPKPSKPATPVFRSPPSPPSAAPPRRKPGGKTR
jgi:hypothetical protein